MLVSPVLDGWLRQHRQNGTPEYQFNTLTQGVMGRIINIGSGFTDSEEIGLGYICVVVAVMENCLTLFCLSTDMVIWKMWNNYIYGPFSHSAL